MKKKKNFRSSNSDIISNLPTNVIDTVLAWLPLREAVRTSTLSKKWRYSWRSLPKLIFDASMLKLLLGDKLLVRYKLISAIHQVLLLHHGTILKFSLSHPLLESCSEIDHLMVFLSKSGVEEFNLQFEKGNLYKLPSSFFSCQELTHLDLQCCEFSPPPAMRGFRRLISLKFVKVTFATYLFESFISSCPQLENLVIRESSRINCSEISAPNLKYLGLGGTCKSLCFKNVPLLQSASFSNLDDEERCRFDEFFGCLPALETLGTDYPLLKSLASGGVPKKIPHSINLKILKLDLISFGELDEVSGLYSLIRSFPMLRRIDIEMCTVEDADVASVLEFLKTLNYSDIMLDELLEVRLAVTGIEAELEFIKLLLAKSPMLETMLIQPKSEDVHFKLELLKKLTKFQRASPIAEILYESEDDEE